MRSKPDWQENGTPLLIHQIGRYSPFFGLLLLFFFLSIVPLQFGKIDDIRPPFLLMGIYYWSIYRPQTLSAPMVFSLGLLIDVITALPLGQTALLFLIAQWLTKTQRVFLFNQSFLLTWWGFCLLVSGINLMNWALFSLFHFKLVDFSPVIASTALGIMVFPFMIHPLYLSYRILSPDKKQLP